jgi:hypothetical protein
MIRELDRVVLSRRLDDLGLEEGDVGTVVLVHEGGRGFEVEFLRSDGDTRGVITLTPRDVRPRQTMATSTDDRT